MLETTPAARPQPEERARICVVGIERSVAPRAPAGTGLRARCAGDALRQHGRANVKEPPETWQPGAVDRKAFFESSPQSLTADLIRDGVTGATGYVAEPFLDGTLRPDILFPAYVAGSNLDRGVLSRHAPSELADRRLRRSALRAVPQSRCGAGRDRPRARWRDRAARHFSERRVAYLTSTGLSTAAVKTDAQGRGPATTAVTRRGAGRRSKRQRLSSLD